jgi:Putative amidoligase enzyme
MKNINKLLTEKFNIGFEFEFYVKNSAIANQLDSKKRAKVRKIPQEVLEQYGHLFVPKRKAGDTFDYEEAGKFFKTKMQETFPQEDWKKSFSITDDASLSNSALYAGVEVIYKHQSGTDALRQLKQILTVLKTAPFVTKEECGLHINISFKDASKNTKDFTFDLVKHLDIEPIKQKFGRRNNEYCENNEHIDIELDEILEDTLSADSIRSVLIGKKSETLRNLIDGIENLKKPENFNKFFNMIESSVKEYCIDSWKDIRPAIAPKKSSSGHYVEFRSTGGKNYQHKDDQVIETINDYLKSMVATDKSLSVARPKMKV